MSGDPEPKLAVAASDDSSNEVYAEPKTVSRFTRWYRSPLFNVIIVGLLSFTQPGIWNALNNTGAGGQQEPYLVNGANSLTFGLMVFGCPLFAILSNKFGLKKILMLGTLGYAPYSASLYVNNRYGVEWFVLFGGVTCGIAASALWASEGAIALGYPTVKDRGKFTGIWLGLRELGQLIGSSIQLSLNVKKNQRGKVGYETYLILIGLQCAGLPLSFLISPPEKVIRSDGTKLEDPTKNKAVLGEFRRAWALLKTKRIFLLLPILIGFNWNGTYLNIYLTKYFSVRSRALGALTTGVAATAANIFWGWFLDLKVFSRPKVARIAWFSFVTIMLSLFGWQIANQKKYEEIVPKVTLDWDTPGFGRAFASTVLFRFMNESHYMFVYWIIGTFNNDIETLTLSVGIVRSFESFGSAVSFGLGAAHGVSPMANLLTAFVMFVICIPTTSLVVFEVPEHPTEKEPSMYENQSEGGAAGDAAITTSTGFKAISASLVVGNPTHVANQPANFDQNGERATYGATGVLTPFSHYAKISPSWYATTKLRDICYENDLVCTGLTLGSTLNLGANHLKYGSTPSVQSQGSDFLISLLS